MRGLFGLAENLCGSIMTWSVASELISAWFFFLGEGDFLKLSVDSQSLATERISRTQTISTFKSLQALKSFFLELNDGSVVGIF